MAQIRGIAIKGLKEFKGHEGEPLLQGNIYFQGKKVGYYSDDFRGGMAVVDIDTKVQHEMFKLSKGYEHPYVNSLDNLIYEVVALASLEKEFTSKVKKGYLGIAEVKGGTSENGNIFYPDRILSLPISWKCWNVEDIMVQIKKFLEVNKIVHDPKGITLFTSISDFIKN